MTLDAEELLLKLNSGKKLSPDEFQLVIELLESNDRFDLGKKISADDLYSLLLVLGKSGEKKYVNLLERFLDIEDPTTVSLVLELLCMKWGFLEEQVERLWRLALGNSWDVEGDVSRDAIKLLGEFLVAKPVTEKQSEPRSLHSLELLLQLFTDPSLEHATRQTAYFSLLRSAAVPWEEIPSEFARLELEPGSADIRWNIIDHLSELVTRYHQKRAAQ